MYILCIYIYIYVYIYINLNIYIYIYIYIFLLGPPRYKPFIKFPPCPNGGTEKGDPTNEAPDSESNSLVTER